MSTLCLLPDNMTRTPAVSSTEARNLRCGIVLSHVLIPMLQFQITTLSSNRTSTRAVNAIRLNANSDGIPRAPETTLGPAKIVGGHRQAAQLPPPVRNSSLDGGSTHQHCLSKPSRRLSKQAAARLTAMCNPFSPTPTPASGANPPSIPSAQPVAPGQSGNHIHSRSTLASQVREACSQTSRSATPRSTSTGMQATIAHGIHTHTSATVSVEHHLST